MSICATFLLFTLLFTIVIEDIIEASNHPVLHFLFTAIRFFTIISLGFITVGTACKFILFRKNISVEKNPQNFEIKQGILSLGIKKFSFWLLIFLVIISVKPKMSH